VLLTPELRALLPATLLSQLQSALAQSLFWVYSVMFLLSIVCLALMFLLTGGRAEQYIYTEKPKEGVEDDFVEISAMG